MKSGMSPSGKAGSAYTEFFVQPGVMQYFTGPYFFKSKKMQVQVDFTLRDSTHSLSDVAMNFTIICEERLRIPENFQITQESSNELIIDVKSEIKPFYAEQGKKDKVLNRFGSFVDYKSFKKFVQSEEKLLVSLNASDLQSSALETNRSIKMRSNVFRAVIQKIEFNQS